MNIEIKPDYAMDSAIDQGERRVVIDNGSDTIKVGFSGEDWPQIITPSVIGVESIKSEMSQMNNNKNQIHFGNSISKEGIQMQNTKIIYPVVRGQIAERTANANANNPNYMVKYWCDILEHDLNLDLTQVNLLLVDSPFNSKEYKKELADIFFEEVKVQSLIFMNSSVLSLFSTGRTRGLVVESGYGFTSTVPVFEGYALEHALNYSFIAGEDIDNQLKNVLIKKYPGSIKELQKREVIRDIKEKILTLATNYDKAINGPDTANEEERSYELPDNTIIELDNKSRYPLTEILYKPHLDNKSYMGLHEMVWDSYRKCDPDLQIDLHKNIVVSGGTSMIGGFVERLEYEMDKKFPYDVSRSDIQYIAEGNRNYASWIGGSMLSSLSVFQELAIKKSEYEENSDLKLSVIHKKTF